MTWLSTAFYKNRRFLNFIVAAIIFLSIVFSSTVVRPFLADVSLAVFYYPFAEIRDSVKRLYNVSEENRRLKNALTEATLQINSLAEARRENQRLREFLGFSPPEGFHVEPVRIISLHFDKYPVAATINKGLNDSIEINQPVVNRFGLVGRIKDVMPEFAVVQLLTDPANAVSARLAESRQIGIARFVPGEGMMLDNLPADARVSVGDLVISSGLGGVYPPGLSVGMVDSVAAPKGEILKSVWIRTNVDFLEIEELFVLRSDHQ